MGAFKPAASQMTGGGGAFSMGKSNAKVYVQKETGITFKDVAGEEEAKDSLKEIVDSCIIRVNIPRSCEASKGRTARRTSRNR
mgnify:CR=1 FL=1